MSKFDPKSVKLGNEVKDAPFFVMGNEGDKTPDIQEGQLLHLSLSEFKTDSEGREVLYFIILESEKLCKTSTPMLLNAAHDCVDNQESTYMRIKYEGKKKAEKSNRSYHNFECHAFSL